MALKSFLLGTFITYIPKLLLGVILLIALIKYVRPNLFKKLRYKHLIISAFAVRAAYALFQTIAQYLVWRGNEFTRLLLTLPLELGEQASVFVKYSPFFTGSKGYFVFYVLSRFWVNAILSLAVAWLFWRFLKFLKNKNERFFEEGETSLGFLCALIVGWPGFIAFVPLLFGSVIFLSIWRKVFYKESYTTLGPVFLLAAALWLVFNPYFTGLFNLRVLYI